MIDKAWCSVEEVPYCFPRSSIKFQGHKGQKIDDLDQIWARLLGRSQLSNPSDLPCFNRIHCTCWHEYWTCPVTYQCTYAPQGLKELNGWSESPGLSTGLHLMNSHTWLESWCSVEVPDLGSNLHPSMFILLYQVIFSWILFSRDVRT